jgi:hypothetical protein
MVRELSSPQRQIFQLKVSLSDVTPLVWRRLLVPGGYTLDRLHRVLQHVMGWQDCHLHSFEIDGLQYGEPDPDGELTMRDELDTRLDAVVGKGSRFRYTYDFGDWWEHDITVEDAFGADPGERYPICVAGARACPPEDVGGPFGYRTFMVALTDPEHPDHEPMREWIGRPFDAEAFAADRATTLARRLC